MTPFASENGNLFGCVSKTSYCEYLVKDTRREKMTQLSQAPLTALFLFVSLSILYRKHLCVFVFYYACLHISYWPTFYLKPDVKVAKRPGGGAL